MVEIKIICRGRDIVGFEVKGHAGYTEKGSDICCAGVSAVTGTAILGLQIHLQNPFYYEAEEGWLKCELPDTLNKEELEKVQIILSTMKAGLLSLQEGYPEYIRVITGGGKDVQD